MISSPTTRHKYLYHWQLYSPASRLTQRQRNEGHHVSSSSTNTLQAENDPESASTDPKSTANLAINLTTTFPSAEVFGIKLVNGQRNDAVISLKNNEPQPITLQLVGGSLWSPDFGEKSPSQLVRNLTTIPYRTEVPAGEAETFRYGIQMEMHPVDLVLKLGAVLSDEEQNFYSMSAFEGNVSVVERPTSWLDPQVYVYFPNTLHSDD